MSPKKQQNGNGFTLVEILVVVAIAAIIIAIVIGSIQASRNAGKDARVRQTLSEMQIKLENSEIAPGVVNYQQSFTQTDVQNAIAALATELGVPAGSYSYSATTTQYVIAFPLASGGYYCVDATHAPKVIGGLPNATGPRTCDNAPAGPVIPTGGGGGAVADVPPTANAGTNQTITLPNNSVTLSGSGADSDGTITTYAWTKFSGPTSGTITSPATASTTVTGLVAGTYVFKLTVTDNGGMTGESTVTVTVNAQQLGIAFNGPHNIPGTIEAEDYDTGGANVGYKDTTPGNTGGKYRYDDVDIETTADTNGGYDVGWTDNGEWLKYTVTVASTGNYQIAARASSATSGGYIQIKMDNQFVAAVDIGNTGGWQTWQTFSTDGIPLTAGPHLMEVDMNISGGGFNLNNLTFTFQGAVVGQNPAARTLSVRGPINGVNPMLFYESLPRGYYDDPNRTYPLLVFLHGIGEASPNPITYVLRHGPPQMISQGAQLEYTINGKTETFVVLAPQSNWWPPEDVNAVIDYAKQNYRIDPTRVYLTGLSLGSEGTMMYPAFSPIFSNAYALKLAAIAPVDGTFAAIPQTAYSSTAPNNSAPLNYCFVPQAGIPTWLFASSGHDPGWITTMKSMLEACTPPDVTQYSYYANSNSSWDQAYAVDHTYNNPNLYEWFLMQHR